MELKRVLSSLLLAGLLLLIAVAAFTRGGYERLFWLPLSVGIFALLAFYLIAQNHQVLPRRLNLRIAIPVIAFLLWAAISYPSSFCQETTLYEVTRLMSLAGVAFLTAAALDKRQNWMLALGIVFIAFFEACYGLIERGSGHALLQLSWIDLPQSLRSVTGTFGNYNHFAAFINMAIFLVLALLTARRGFDRPGSEQLAQKALLVVPLAVMLLALLLSLSRGGWIGFASGFMIYLWLLWRGRYRALSRVPLVALLVLGLAAVFLARMDTVPLVERVKTVEEIYRQPLDEINTEGRLSIWKSSLAMVRDHPLFGTGWGAFRLAYPAYRDGKYFYGPRFAHNDYLQIAAGMGIPGLIFFLAFVGLVFSSGLKKIREGPRDPDAQALPAVLAGMVAILVHEFVDFSLMLPANAMVFFAMVGIVVRVSEDDQ